MYLILLSTIAIAWIAVFIHDVIAFLGLPWLTASTTTPSAFPSVSILVAARNEADVIEQTLTALLHLDYPNFEVIVIDDRSGDSTAEIARKIAEMDDRVSVIDGTELPVDWMGKSWALHQGIKHARGEWLLFTDADCTHHPLSLKTALEFARSKGINLVSIVPALSRLSLAEKFVTPAFVSLLGTFFPVGRLNPHPKKVFASGGFFLIERSVYDAVDGHSAIRSSLLDDVNLARRVKAAGYSAWTFFTPDLVTTQQYDSLDSVVEGLGKHAFEFMGCSIARAMIFISGLLLMVGVPVVSLLISAFFTASLPMSLSAIPVAVMVLLGIGSTKLLHIRWMWGFLVPVGLLFYGWIVVVAVVKVRRGALVWSGRRYGR